ncbi:MAG TPA: SIS domain-containing protein [Anaerolineae bacterium]
MRPSEAYFEAVNQAIRTIHDHQGEPVMAAARVLADQIARGRVIHVVGTGAHSMIGAEEMFYRAGGLVPINPIFDPGFSMLFGGARSTVAERTPGYMPGILKQYGLEAGDAMIIVNAYGVNSATIDSALEAKRLGLTTIGVTGTDTADRLPAGHPSRHPSGKKLYETVDIFVNTYVPMGDGVIRIPGVPEQVGPVSTYANAFALNWIMVETVTMLAERGVPPPIWQSANSPGGEEHNRDFFARYHSLIKHL